MLKYSIWKQIRMKLKQWQNIFFVLPNANSIAWVAIQIKKWNNETCQEEYKNYRNCKKDCSWNPRACICENSKYLKSIADTLVIACDKIISVSVIDIVSTKMTNTIATNVTKIVIAKMFAIFARDCYILHTVLLVIALPLIFIIIWYHYANQKSIDELTISNGVTSTLG